MPACSQNGSVGPLTERPPTNGLTATTGAGAPRSASLMPGRARIGPIEMTGFEGPITIASASATACRTASDGGARSRPRSSTPSIGPRGPLDDHELLEGQPAPARLHPGRDRLVAHRQHARAHAQRLHHRLRAPRVSVLARAQALGSQQAHREVAVAEPEPVRASRAARARPSPARCRPRSPQPRSSISSASQYVTRSGSGETWTP